MLWDSPQLETDQIESLDAVDLLTSLIKTRPALPPVRRTNVTAVNDDELLKLASLSLSRDDLNTSYLEPFLDASVLAEHLEVVFSGMAALAVHNHMLSPTSEKVQGSVWFYNGWRVHAQNERSAIPIFALLSLCTIVAILLLILRPLAVLSRDPRSLGGIAIILNDYHKFMDSSGLASRWASVRQARLLSLSTTDPNQEFRGLVEHLAISDKEHKPAPRGTSGTKPWQPFVLRTRYRVISVILPLLVMSLLEYIQRTSDLSNGFVGFTFTSTTRDAINFIPALVMWSISAFYGSIHFHTLLLSPYQAMSLKEGAVARRGFLSHNLGRLPLFSLLVSIRDKHTSACFSAIGTILGAFLTIVVSGLYSNFQAENRTSTVMLQRTDSFDLNSVVAQVEADHGAIGHGLNPSPWQNLTKLEWIYDDMVFPKLNLVNAQRHIGASSGRITVSVPARRAVLQCAIAQSTEVTVTIENSRMLAKLSADFQDSCPSGTRQIAQIPGQMSKSDGSELIGKSGFIPTNTTSPGLKCHSLVFTYGSIYIPPEITSSEGRYTLPLRNTRMTTLACSPLVQEVDVKISLLTDDGLRMDPIHSPDPSESTVRAVDSNTFGASNVQQYLFDNPASLSVATDPVKIECLQASEGLDWFYQGVIIANNTDSDDLIGPESLQRLVDATSKMYGRYMAQVMHFTMRAPDTSFLAASEKRLQGEVVEQQTRLRQNSGPKIVLQVLLGLMAACGLGAWRFMRDTRFLSHKPGSIASAALLVAGSELWDADENGSSILPDGAEWMSDETLIKLWEAQGLSFGLARQAEGSYGVNIVRKL